MLYIRPVVQALLFLCMPYSRSPAGTASRLGRKKYRSAKREDDFFPADPKGPGLALRWGTATFASKKRVCRILLKKSSAPITFSGMKILICSHIIRHETLCQDMTCADRSIVIRFFLLLFATGERLGRCGTA